MRDDQIIQDERRKFKEWYDLSKKINSAVESLLIIVNSKEYFPSEHLPNPDIDNLTKNVNKLCELVNKSDDAQKKNKDKTTIKEIRRYIKNTPNDMELGSKIRHFMEVFDND